VIHVISYEPLHKTLREQGLVLSDFRGNFLNPRTQAAINSNKPVNLTTIEKLCKELNVPIEKVVEIK
jgi:hypothetical protein